MKYLLDTHTILWFLDDNVKLSGQARSIILAPDNEKYISIASAWEIAIKVSIEKLRFDGGVCEFFRVVHENGFFLLPVERAYVECVQNLPLFHRDPFDRLLIATAMSEGINLVTADENIRLYDVDCIW